MTDTKYLLKHHDWIYFPVIAYAQGVPTRYVKWAKDGGVEVLYHGEICARCLCLPHQETGSCDQIAEPSFVKAIVKAMIDYWWRHDFASCNLFWGHIITKLTRKFLNLE
jgi:hypothetical protein